MVGRILLILVVMATFYGCGQASAPQEEVSNQKPKKVVVNEGLSKEEEQELSQRLEELEQKVEEAPQEATSQPVEQTTQEPSLEEGRTEAALLTAVEDYYQAVHVADWAYTYSHLDSQTQALFDEEEWRSKNQYYADLEQLGQPSTIDVQVNNSVLEPVVGVSVFRAFDSGTTIDRDTAFVWEDGEWKHRFIGEELELYMPEASYEEFVAVQEGASPSSASATATATATASPSSASKTQEAGTKHVKVVVTSDVPVDVSITDDNFDASIAEEITGTKTYEFDIASDSGLLVSAMNMDMDSMSGNVSIAVYENGKLKTEDSDSTGYAQIMY